MAPSNAVSALDGSTTAVIGDSQQETCAIVNCTDEFASDNATAGGPPLPLSGGTSSGTASGWSFTVVCAVALIVVVAMFGPWGA